MKSLIILCALTVAGFLQSQAQSLYMPRNVKQAFENGTRSMNGNPGPHYWQNHGYYNIHLTVMPPGRLIKGTEEITYFNDSPDTLKTILINLFQNFHKPEAAHFHAMDSALFNSGLHIDRFAINGKATVWHDPENHYTWQFVPLPRSLNPGDSIHLSFDWHYQIARKSGREGMIDSTTFYIAYFYPRVGVYDDYGEWNLTRFTGPQQFYNDFNNYLLKVTVPDNYMVWATGVLENPDQVLNPHDAQLLKASMTTDSVIHIVTPANDAENQITEKNVANTWIWQARDVTDVALCIGNHYDWDASSVVVDSAAHRRVSIQAAYFDTSSSFHQAVAIGQKALSWLSRKLPGVPYPYPKMTVIEGFAGMEYPMMVNDGSFRSSDIILTQLEENHEIAHTYFPFFMGTNEASYAFMDEGWATTFEFLMAVEQHGKSRADSDFENFRVKWWTDASPEYRGEQQVPIMMPSDIEDGIAYGSNAYGKPALAYLALKDLLGDQLFKKCLQGYIARWHGKHPIPWDFFNSFNDISGKDLNWFWSSWFFSHGYDDLAVGKVTETKEGYAVRVNNIGGFAIPFDLKINYSDGSTQDIHATPVVWKKAGNRKTITISTKKMLQSLTIDTGIWMDANEKDNRWVAAKQ